MKNHLLPAALLIAILALIYINFTTSVAKAEATHRVARATEDLAKKTHDNTLATAELARMLERQTNPTCRADTP